VAGRDRGSEGKRGAKVSSGKEGEKKTSRPPRGEEVRGLGTGAWAIVRREKGPRQTVERDTRVFRVGKKEGTSRTSTYEEKGLGFLEKKMGKKQWE